MSTVAPTTTVALLEIFLDETREALRREGYGTRKKALADVTEIYPELDGVGGETDDPMPHIRFEPRKGFIDTPEVTVCELGRSGPDPDHISLVLRLDSPTADPFLSHGIFRRGSDG